MNFLNRFAKITAKIEPNELRAVMLSFSFVFTILASYYILRPVRDAMSSDWSDAQLSTIWTFTFLISFFVVSLYGYACSKIKFKLLVPSIYGIFALTFYFLFLLTNFFPGLNLINQIFYVWVSVFSLLNISVFWSFMADTYNKEQAKRLFGFIAAGSSLGAFCGPLITILFAKTVGSNGLILISATMLFIPVLIAIFLQRIKETDLQNTTPSEFNEQPMGAKIFSGFKELGLNPLLLGIGIFIVLYSGMNTIFYYALKNFLTDVDQATRTQIWAGIDLAVNVLSILTAMFGTGRLAARFGLSVTLPLVPMIITILLFTFALSPMLWTFVGLQIVRRAGEYAITKPAREMLFTTVDRESRFKAKSVIDVVIYRGADVSWGWAYTSLTQLLGFGLAGIAVIGALIASIWSLLAVYLGRNFDRYQVVESETKSNSLRSSG
jgi:AAA family ATP:ADP antiporter|tara:strand:- start:270 stop:1580 length:1311 start_codon:yes stop_codon:yes gene_type:complete